MHRNKWKWKHDNPKPMGLSKSSAKREVHNNTSLPQETRETSNKHPNFIPKATRKRTTTTTTKYPKLVEGKKS